jgi:CHAT domain-containing protein
LENESKLPNFTSLICLLALTEPYCFVADETVNVEKILGGERFLDGEFTASNLVAQVKKNYPVLHLATHATFGGTLENTFLLAYDRAISLTQLEEILGNRTQPIELLVLSACDTAAGNSRAVLGLAGVALRAGVRSVLASLWATQDETTAQVITDFYQNLKAGISQAQALQKAQLNQIARGTHPLFWSPFVSLEN